VPVLHTLNLRLSPDQLTYIINHAQDRVIIVDATLIPLLAAVLSGLTTVAHVVVVGDGDDAPLRAAGGDRVAVHGWAQLLRGKPDHYDWPELDENDGRRAVLHVGNTDHPKGVAYSHRSIYLHSMQVCSTAAFGLGTASRRWWWYRCSTPWRGGYRTGRCSPAVP